MARRLVSEPWLFPPTPDEEYLARERDERERARREYLELPLKVLPPYFQHDIQLFPLDKEQTLIPFLLSLYS